MDTRKSADMLEASAPSLGGKPLADWLIRDLVEAYPETMGPLGPLGIDLCCGGGHPLGEALDLHSLDRETILPRIGRIVASGESNKE
jgi:iron-sulfur cluster repair protein YtfE (RIC family)